MSRAVGRITALLELLSSQGQPLGLSDIATATGLDKSTTYRFLRACESEQIVRRDPVTRRYSLGIRIIDWGGRALNSIDVVNAAEPILEHLNKQTQETIGLYVRQSQWRCVVAVRRSPRMTVVSLRVGWIAPLPLGAPGKVFLAFMDECEVADVFEAHPQIDAALRQRIESELPRIRQLGFATSQHEISPHAWSVAAPIFGPATEPIASIAISTPTSRYSLEAERKFIEQIVEAREEITRRMGGGCRWAV